MEYLARRVGVGKPGRGVVGVPRRKEVEQISTIEHCGDWKAESTPDGGWDANVDAAATVMAWKSDHSAHG